MRVVLRNWERPRNDLRLVSVSPSCLVLVRVVCTSWLQSLKIREMEDFLRVSDKLAFLELWHGETIDRTVKVDKAYHVNLIQAYIDISTTADR